MDIMIGVFAFLPNATANLRTELKEEINELKKIIPNMTIKNASIKRQNPNHGYGY